MMLSECINNARLELSIMKSGLLVSEAIVRATEYHPTMICIASMPPGGGTQARLLGMRLRTRFPELKILVGRWGYVGDVKKNARTTVGRGCGRCCYNAGRNGASDRSARCKYFSLRNHLTSKWVAKSGINFALVIASASRHNMISIDWSEIFAVQMPVAEIVLRGTSIYLFLFVVFRFIVRRDVGAVALADVLILVIVADAAQNAMAGGYKTVTEGFILIATIIGWNILFDWLAFKSTNFAKWVQPRPLQLVRHGEILKTNLAKELLTVDDLMGMLREQGVESLTEVKHMYLEGDGKVSVIKQSKQKGLTEKSPQR